MFCIDKCKEFYGYALTVSHLNKHYEKFYIKDVSFNATKGSITGFIVHNEASKTTTLKSIMNLVHCDEGEIIALNHNMLTEQQIAFSLRELFSDFSLLLALRLLTLTLFLCTIVNAKALWLQRFVLCYFIVFN